MKQLYICVDVDLTVVDPIFQPCGWIDYLNKMSKYPILYREKLTEEYNTNIPYNLGELYPDLTKDEVMSFWRSENLYDKLEPYQDAVEVLVDLANKGHYIIFASHAKHGHFKNKYQFLEKHFGSKMPDSQWGYVATKEKKFIKCDIIVDDRNDFLNRMDNSKVELIKFKTPFEQHETLKNPVLAETNDWFKIKEIIEEIAGE